MLELTAVEARVLGSLIEKSRTTPDYYPMTLNALTAACNQSSNREPVTTYSEEDVEEAMRSLREKNAARSVRTSGSRMMKHRHDLENLLVIDIPASSLLAVLLLRGAQTVGELRTRTERYHPFDDLDEVEAALEAMATDDPALVRRLDRQPGQKEARWIQLLTADAADDVDQSVSAEPTLTPPTTRSSPGLEERVAALEARVAELEALLED